VRPGKYQEGHLRTFQRRVSDWRALHTEQVLTLPQVRKPGEVLQTDGTCMNALGITIAGEQFDHVLIHSVLPYSNWEWGVVAQSESLVAIQRGFQAAVGKLGRIPSAHQTDNTTAATHDLRAAMDGVERSESGRAYNAAYLALLAHYEVKPRTTHLDAPDENGDIEAMHGALKRALEQHLLLRGSRDFASVEAYEEFVQTVMARRNAGRTKRLAEELAAMRPLRATPLADGRQYWLTVSRDGTIRLLNNVYTVASGLARRRVKVWVYEWELEVYHGTQLVRRMPRLIGRDQADVDYRHVIGTLLVKPGGFRNYRYRDCLFPTPVFRAAWEALERSMSPRRADLNYLRILKLAADHLESDVELALKMVLQEGQRWDHETIAGLVQPQLAEPPAVERGEVDLGVYDQLLAGEGRRDVA
jgi:hypothetical protein